DGLVLAGPRVGERFKVVEARAAADAAGVNVAEVGAVAMHRQPHEVLVQVIAGHPHGQVVAGGLERDDAYAPAGIDGVAEECSADVRSAEDVDVVQVLYLNAGRVGPRERDVVRVNRYVGAAGDQDRDAGVNRAVEGVRGDDCPVRVVEEQHARRGESTLL